MLSETCHSVSPLPLKVLLAITWASSIVAVSESSTHCAVNELQRSPATSLLQKHSNSVELFSNIENGESTLNGPAHGPSGGRNGSAHGPKKQSDADEAERSQPSSTKNKKQWDGKDVPKKGATLTVTVQTSPAALADDALRHQKNATAKWTKALESLKELPPSVSQSALLGAEQGVAEASTTASKQTVASAAMVGGTVMVGLGYFWPVDKGHHATQGSRSLLLDNAKVAAQFFVIYIHLFYYNLVHSENPDGPGYHDWKTWLYDSSDFLKALLDGLSAVVVPMLCFISGVLSRGPPTPRRLRRFMYSTVVPTLLWVYFVKPVILETMMDPNPQSLAERLNAVLQLRSFREEWYLEALVLWRGSVFLVWSHLQPGAALLGMLGLSSAAGYFNLNGPLWYLKLDDAMGFLPYFAIGYAFPFELACRFTEQMHVPRMVAMVLAMLWVFALIPLAGPLPDGHGDYQCCAAGGTFRSALGWDYSLYWTRRLARVVLEMPPVLLLFFYVIPRCKTSISWVGQYIIYPYLFHQVANHWRDKLFQTVVPPRLLSTPSHISVLLVHVPYAAFLLVFFASGPWRKLFSWCFEPRWLTFFLKDEEDNVSYEEADKQEGVSAESQIQGSLNQQPRGTSPAMLTAAALARIDSSTSSMVRDAPEDDAVSIKSIPELLPSRRSAGRSTRWMSAGYEIPWQCQARKYYVWLLPIFIGTLISAVFPFWLCVFYLPGWEVLLKVVEGFPLAFGIPIFFVALACSSITYVWHFLRLHGTDEEPEPSTADPLTHAVVVCAYKEPLDVLRRTMDSIIAQRGLWKRPIVVFAAEERDDTAQATFAELSKRVGDHFDMFLLTRHPLVEGETIGKSSNENFAVQELYKRLVDEEARDPFEVLVTIVDADSIMSPTYLAHAENSFRAQRDGRRLIYSGPLSVHRNFADAGILTQCYEINRCHSDTFHDPFSMYQPQSNYSLTLGFAQELGFWTPDLMPEDIHTANKARVNNFGSRTTVAIPSIICNDLVVQFEDRYTQAKRHQMGSITEFAWAMALFFESKASLSGWWAVFNVEAGRDGSFLDIARSIVGYGCKCTVTYIICTHWSMLHWKSRLYLGFAFSCLVWRWLWFWIAELFLWQSLLLQFPVKRPTVARWMLIVCTMPIMLLVGEMIFYVGATLQCLWRITFIGELSYVSAPKGDDLPGAEAVSSASSTCAPSTAGGNERSNCNNA